MTKFKGRSSTRQYLKIKAMKWGFKWWFQCAFSTGYLHEFDLHICREKDVEDNLGISDVIV